jgi:hypothetical protein
MPFDLSNMPRRVQALPRDRRGLPIPAIVMRDPTPGCAVQRTALAKGVPMNAQRRREIARIVTALDKLGEDLDAVIMDERDAYEGLSEKAQESERGERMQEAVDTLQQAWDDLDGVVSNLRGLVEE